MPDRYFSDEELVAFLDGETEHVPAAEIEQSLENDDALLRRIEALQVDRESIARSFKGLGPDPSSIPDLLSAQTSARSGIANVAVAATLALAIGLASGAWLQNQARSGWTDYVAAYQALYSTSTVAHISTDAAVQGVELERASKAIGKSVPLDALKNFPEAEYKRAQVLSFEGRALMQLVFQTSTGAPLALCIIRSDAPEMASIKAATKEGMSSAWWAKDGYEYLLIGGQDAALVERMATSLVTADL